MAGRWGQGCTPSWVSLNSSALSPLGWHNFKWHVLTCMIVEGEWEGGQINGPLMLNMTESRKCWESLDAICAGRFWLQVNNATTSSSSSLPCQGMEKYGHKASRTFIFEDIFLGRRGMVQTVGILQKATVKHWVLVSHPLWAYPAGEFAVAESQAPRGRKGLWTTKCLTLHLLMCYSYSIAMLQFKKCH